MIATHRSHLRHFLATGALIVTVAFAASTSQRASGAAGGAEKTISVSAANSALTVRVGGDQRLHEVGFGRPGRNFETSEPPPDRLDEF